MTDVEVKILGAGDGAVLERVAAGVFDHEVEPALASEFLGDPRHHIAVAIADHTVVGFVSAVHYVHPDKPPELWVNEVGVAPSHQREGIGKQLLEALFAHGRTLGCAEAWLGTDESNIAARRLYGSVGGEEAVMMYVTFRLEGRAV